MKNRYICPVSPVQKQFWLVNQLYPDSSAHNIPSVFLMEGALDTDALEQSLKQIIHRHENFRTTIVASEGMPVQEIWREIDFSLPIDDVRESFQSISNEEINKLIKPEVSRPFNLSKGPLVRCRLFRLGADRYLLTIVMHHIITDLRTKDLFSDELSALYNAYVAKSPLSLIEPNCHYSDFALWYQKFQQDNDHDRMLLFWEKSLDTANDYLNLPIIDRRPQLQSLNGKAFPFCLAEELTEQLKQFSQDNNTQIFLTLLTAYAVLLGRYSNQTDFVVGVPFTNRRKENHKDIMGCCMNILPIPIDLSDNPDFLTLLRRIRMTMLAAHRNQEVVLEEIVHKIKPKRDASFNPVFQAGFTFEHPMSLPLTDLDITPLPTHCGGSQLDIFAVFWETETQVKGHFEYSTNLLSSESVSQFAESYQIFLETLLQNPEMKVANLPLLAEGEKRKILLEWNDTYREYPVEHILKKIFESQVEKTPDKTALVFNDVSISYSDLNEKANKLANYIVQLDIKPGTYIGIYMDRSIEMILAIYGIVKAGCAYVPFDPEFPVERLQFMLEDTEVPIILTQHHLSKGLTGLETKTVEVDTDWEVIERNSNLNPDIDIIPDMPAYVIFTSGSTGRPKGVVNSNRGICNRLLWMQEEYKLSDQDTVLQKTPFSFDVSVWEFFWPLMTGAKLVVAPPGAHKDPSSIIRIISENNISIIHFVPSMLNIFMGNQQAHTCTSLKKVFCSGESLQNDDQEKFFSIFNAELHNLYGPTEAAVDVTFWACKKKNKDSIVPIGKPVANTQIYILDKFLNPVPAGVQGELHIGGVQVASGYLNRPELTREKFISDPFSDKTDARLYKTGDLARFLPDGTIEYMGRVDHQVKVSGLRIELGEIESVLCDHPLIKQAVVMVKDYGDSDKRLVAYLVPDKEKTVDNDEVKKHMLTKLPNYMIPSFFVLLKEMPLTQSGKINRKMLPEAGIEYLNNEQEYVAPRSDFEIAIAEIWAKLLKRDRVGIHDNFFDIGGTSLLSARFVSELQIVLKKEVSIVKLFQYPTVSSFVKNFEDEKFIKRSTIKSAKRRAELTRKALKRRIREK